mmetsp:Transcript_15871/g.21783  ORF Transcript_15871/g.21783 Transcript_15871/m.21783 type:complete len:290 (-) Transcript_15871:462-1331(-)
MSPAIHLRKYSRLAHSRAISSISFSFFSAISLSAFFCFSLSFASSFSCSAAHHSSCGKRLGTLVLKSSMASAYALGPLLIMCSISCGLVKPHSRSPLMSLVSVALTSVHSLKVNALFFPLSSARAVVIIRRPSSRENDSSAAIVPFAVPSSLIMYGIDPSAFSLTDPVAMIVKENESDSKLCAEDCAVASSRADASVTRTATFSTDDAAFAVPAICPRVEAMSFPSSPPLTTATQDLTPSSCSTVGSAPAAMASEKSSLSRSPVYRACRLRRRFLANLTSSTKATILSN